MTISEAIEELRSRKLTMSMCVDIESCRNANNAIDMSISALQENDKLKAEIEQLRARINAYEVKKDFKEFCDSRDIEESKLKFREIE